MEETMLFARTISFARTILCVRTIGTLLLTVFLAPTAMLRGQSATGEVNGSVTDSSGAAVSEAAVKLVNKATGIEDLAATNASGYFVFTGVKPGSYVLNVSAPGFKSTQVLPFDVGVSQSVTHNIQLQVGAVTETV